MQHAWARVADSPLLSGLCVQALVGDKTGVVWLILRNGENREAYQGRVLPAQRLLLAFGPGRCTRLCHTRPRRLPAVGCGCEGSCTATMLRCRVPPFCIRIPARDDDERVCKRILAVSFTLLRRSPRVCVFAQPNLTRSLLANGCCCVARTCRCSNRKCVWLSRRASDRSRHALRRCSLLARRSNWTTM